MKTVVDRLAKINSRKIIGILYGFLFFVFIIVIRLFYLQIEQREELHFKGEHNFLKLEVLYPRRGNLLDCNNNLLATNRPIFDLYWEGSGKQKLTQNQFDVFKKVLDIIGEDYKNKVGAIRRAEKNAKRICISKDISFDKLCLISEQCSDSSNLLIINRFRRLYPHKNFACHILGHLGKAEEEKLVGRYGLEKIFQDKLKGQAGYTLNVINSMGKKLEKIKTQNAEPGNDIKLTLDLKMQQIAEQSFEKDKAGAFIVMDPEDGAIRVLASFPTFDPNDFLNPISKKEWKEKFSVENPFLNRCTSALYPPASIFKLITWSAGLEEEVIGEDSIIKCRGHIKFCGRKYGCVQRWGHGELSCREAIAKSCNIHCFEIGKLLKIDQIADYAQRFGFGYKTKFLISDRDGLVPTSKWKMQQVGERWWGGETLSASIGQSYLLVTPLQVAKMIGAISRGFLVKPRLLESEEIEKDGLNLKTQTLDVLRDAMGMTVGSGTGRLLKRLKDFKIWAKTGTAQTTSLKKAKTNNRFLEHGWFASYFSYKDENPLVLIVLVERVGTARPALLSARRFLENYGKMRKRSSG